MFSRSVSIAALLVCAVVVAMAPSLRWRAHVLALHLTGRIPDIELGELLTFLHPASEQSVRRLIETRNPYATIENRRTSTDDLAAGARLFRDRCAACHGPDARGGAQAPALIGRSLMAGASDWAIYRTIRGGVPNTTMRPHRNLSDTQVWQLVGFIRSIDLTEQLRQEKSARTPTVHVSYRELRAITEPRADWLTYSGSYSGTRHSTLAEINPGNVQQLTLRWIHELGAATQMSPLVRGGTMFVMLPGGKAAALDATTGRVIWSQQLASAPDPRGVALLGDRVFAVSANTRLAALSAVTGEKLWETAVTEDDRTYLMTSAPLAYRGLVVTGVATSEGGRGFVVALDAATGKERWRFHAIPAEGEPHNDTWEGDSWREGGAPTWLTGSYDPDLDVLYWGVGNPKPDYDADVRRGDNLYSNSVVALNGSTGKLVWFFQFTPADNRDWDANQIPMLVDRTTSSGTQKLLLTANRNGFYYVLDRVTGKFLRAEPFVRQTWARGIAANGRPILMEESATSSGRLVFPGNVGGTNWWPPSYDASLGLVFVPVIEQGMVFFASSSSWPTASNRPFFTAIRALDAFTGRQVWEARNPPRTRRNRSAGVVSTSGGLVFASDATEFFALDSRTGARLWSIETGGYISAAPIVYEVAGTQFVTIAAGQNLLSFSLAPQPAAAAVQASR